MRRAREIPSDPSPSQSGSGGAWRRRTLPLALLFLAAFGIRVGHLYLIRDNPYFENPPLDAGAYDVMARDVLGLPILQGQTFLTDAYYKAPFQTYFLATIYWIAGGRYLFLACLAQAVLDALTCLLIFGIGRKVAGVRAAWIAGIMAAFYGPFIFYQGMPLETTAAVFFLAATLLALLHAAERRSLLLWGFAGLICGLGAVARPNFLILIPCILIWMAWIGRRYPRPILLACVALFAIGTAVPILPVTIRNYAVGKDYVLISSNGGQNFFIGSNGQNRTGSVTDLEGIRQHPLFEAHDFGASAEETTGKPMLPSQVSRFYYRRGLDFILGNPGAYLILQGKKILLFLNRVELPDCQNIYLFRRFAPVLRAPLLPFWIIAPLGLAGLVPLWRRSPGHLLMTIFLAAYAASVIAFYVTSRYRMPVLPVLIVFAAATVDGFLLDVREGGMRRGWRWLAAVLVMGLIVNIPLPFADVRMDRAHIQLGELLVLRGEDDLARVEFEDALRLNPGATGALASLGQIHLRKGELEKAEEMFWRWSELKPDRGEPVYNLGLVHQQAGNLLGAQAQYWRALELDPTFLPAYRNLAIVLDELDKVDGAVQVLQTALDRVDPQWAEGLFTLGVIWEGREKYERALDAYLLTQKVGYPDRGALHMRLALCHASMGNVEEALGQLQILQAMGYRPDKSELARIYDLLPLGPPR